MQGRLQELQEFKSSEVYADFLANFEMDKSASEAQVFDQDVRDIFGFFIREQTIGERRVQASVVNWFNNYEEELKQTQEKILSEMELANN